PLTTALTVFSRTMACSRPETSLNGSDIRAVPVACDEIGTLPPRPVIGEGQPPRRRAFASRAGSAERPKEQAAGFTPAACNPARARHPFGRSPADMAAFAVAGR